MSPEIISILALVAIFAIATFLPINMGALAFVAAFLVGTLAVGMTTDDIIAGFPGELVLTLIGVTYLLAIAQNNGTVDLLVRGAVKLVAGRVAFIPWIMFAVTGVLTAIGNVKSIQKESFFNFSNVGKPEKITSDTDPIGVYNATDCYEDANNNNRYDTALNSGIGTADDIVRYKVTVTYPDLLPAKGLLGWGNEQTIVASTVLRNEPFTGRSQPTIRCS